MLNEKMRKKMFHVKRICRGDENRKNSRITARNCFLIVWLLLCMNCLPVPDFMASGLFSAQAQAVEMKTVQQTEDDSSDEVMDMLRVLQESMEQKRNKLQSLQLEARVATDDQKQALEQEIEELQSEISENMQTFNHMAAGEELEVFEQEEQQQFTLDQQLKIILAPLMREMSDLTRRPREIDTLRTRIEQAQERLPAVERILLRLNTLMEQTNDLELRARLETIRNDWAETKSNLENELQLAKYKLDQVLAERRSISGTLGKVLESFFKTRGKNLLIAILSFAGIFLILRWLKTVLYKMPYFKRLESQSFYLRLLNLVFSLLAVVMAGFAALASLYAAGDWLLLVFFFILFLSLAWSARAGMLQFFEEIKLILNIGGVRENERIIYRGIPWRVQRLNYYTRLDNPELSGGGIRVRLGDLIEYVSRPFAPDEPWFPTRKGDWVLLDDEVYGKVVQQNPDMVRLWLFGDSFKTYQTPAFLNLNPKVISTGFLIRSNFGVDYRHQDIATSIIPETFEQEILQALEEAGQRQLLKGLTVDFLQAGDSALNIVIFASFDGKAADNYFGFGRLIQKTCVRTCSQKGWTIPFPQITVHKGGA